MISSVVMVGRIGESLPNGFRYIETDCNDVLHPDVSYVSNIPVLYWTREKSNPISESKYGALIVIRGRIERNEDIGLYILAETVQFMKT